MSATDDLIELLAHDMRGPYGRFALARAALTVAWVELGLRWLHDRAYAGYRASCGCSKVCGITLVCREHDPKQALPS